LRRIFVISTTAAQELLDLDAISERLERALEHSPADETELVWIEARQGEAVTRGQRVNAGTARHRTVMARVLDRGRVGSHRTGFGDGGEIADAIRQAIAQSRVNAPLQGLPHLPADETDIGGIEPLHCPEIAELSKSGARSLLTKLRRQRETLSLDWTSARVVVFNSRGVRRRAETTSVALQIRRSRRPGGGRAATASRTLAAIDGRRLWKVAAARHASGDTGELPREQTPVVLSGEAAIELVALLNRTALSASSYADGTSFLREHLGVQVFDRGISLRDDATDPHGLPFPFDLEGTAKRPVEMIAGGVPKTPALDQRQAAQVGLPPTAHSISGNDARAENLFLLPGEASESELLGEADGGVWIGWLDAVAPIEPRRVRFLAHARGVRRIRDGQLAEALPDCTWDESLLRCLSESPRVGREPVRRLSRDGILGGICAPPVLLSAHGLRPLGA
jgi:predicted Zn-dependent protease